MAYCRIKKQVKSNKINPRAEISFLVGYLASNIYKIWFPHTGKVRHIRDAVVNKTRKYTPTYEKYQPIPLPIVEEPQELTTEEIAQVINHKITSQQPATIDSIESQHIQEDIQQSADITDTSQQVTQEVTLAETNNAGGHRERTPSQGVSHVLSLPTPDHPFKAPPGAFPDEADDLDLPPLPATPPEEVDEPAVTGPSQGVNTQEAQEVQEAPQVDQIQLRTIEQTQEDELHDKLERQLQAELLAPNKEIIGDVNASNILSGKRTRRAKRDDNFAYATTRVDEEPPALLHAFAAGLYAEKPDARRHRDDLPPPPKH